MQLAQFLPHVNSLMDIESRHQWQIKQFVVRIGRWSRSYKTTYEYVLDLLNNLAHKWKFENKCAFKGVSIGIRTIMMSN